MVKRVWPVIVVVVGLFAPPAGAGQDEIPAPVLHPPPKVVSLHRPTAEWKVVTTIVLAIEPTTAQLKRVFRWSSPDQGGTVACNGEMPNVHEVTLDVGTSSITCTYQPAVGFPTADVNIEKFTYSAAFKGDTNQSAFAPDATVTVEVRERGLRWEFKTNATTITSDSPDPDALAQIPSIIGGTSQDFLFSVNWQTMHPGKNLMDKSLAKQPRLLRKADLIPQGGPASQTANFLVETGVQSDPVAATVEDVGRSATTAATGGSGGGTGTGTTTEQAVARRNLVLRGEFNYNAGFSADGIGRFVEIGALGRGSFTTVLDSNESFKEAVGRVLQVVPKDRSAYKLDAGIRLAIKQSHETDSTTLVNPDGRIEYPTNIENAVLVEAGFRFDKSLKDVMTSPDELDSQKRLFVRAELSPEIPILPGHEAPTIGFEVSTSLHGHGTPTVKVTYGVKLSASKGIFSKS